MVILVEEKGDPRWRRHRQNPALCTHAHRCTKCAYGYQRMPGECSNAVQETRTMSPEAVRESYDSRINVWSPGMVVVEMKLQGHPWRQLQRWQVLCRVSYVPILDYHIIDSG